jgi:hypothetical protein
VQSEKHVYSRATLGPSNKLLVLFVKIIAAVTTSTERECLSMEIACTVRIAYLFLLTMRRRDGTGSLISACGLKECDLELPLLCDRDNYLGRFVARAKKFLNK